jgi:menaquinone-dependent protoporphyrinogen oxidase
MSRILFVFGTTDGHTAKVVATAADALRADGESVDVVEAPPEGPGPRPEEYHAVLVAASVHAGGYQRAVFRWVRTHADALNPMPTGFLTVCLAVLEDNPRSQKDLAGIVQRFVVKTGWRPSLRKYVAGALLYTKYGWVKRFIMKRIATKTGGDTDTSRDYVYTDWGDLSATVRAFATGLHAAPPKTSAATP